MHSKIPVTTTLILATVILFACNSNVPSNGNGPGGELLTGMIANPHSGEAVFQNATPHSEGTGEQHLSDEELAYLALLFSRAGVDFDLSRIPLDTDGDAIPNVVDDDIDGDGLLNPEDDDIDGDGKPNTDDNDIDGDGIDNDDDDDIDSDGIENDDDPDADSDGLSDRWDLDDDGDGTADDEDEDDMDDEPKSRLEDLVDAVANRGWLSDFERQQIAIELARRFDDPGESAELFGIIRDATLLNETAARPAPVNANVNDTSPYPSDHNAIDEIYKQLTGAIEEAKRGQFNPDGPIANDARLRNALNDFKARARAVVDAASQFGSVRLGEISDGIEELRPGLGQARFGEFIQGIADNVPPDRLGQTESETQEFNLLVKGGSSIGEAFDDNDTRADKILDGISRLRSLVADEQSGEPDEDEFDRLLDRLSEIKSEASGITLEDAIDQIEMEETEEEEDSSNDDD